MRRSTDAEAEATCDVVAAGDRVRGMLMALTAADQDDSSSGGHLVIAACLLFAGIGLWGLVRDLRWLLLWPVATGTVVGSIPIGDERTRAPVVEFRTR